MANEALDTNKAAERLGIGRQRVLDLIYAGRLKATRLSSFWLIMSDDLEAVKDRKPGKPRKQANA